MKIEITQYTREDDVALIKIPEGWVLRSIHGPSWFWNRKTNDWDVYSVIRHKLKVKKKYLMSERVGLKLLETVKKKAW